MSDEIKMWEHNGWGNSVYFLEINDISKLSRITGHLRPQPRKGDKFLSKMESGKIGIFEVKEIDNCLNPPDQFFAKVKFSGYKKEN